LTIAYKDINLNDFLAFKK